MQRPSGDCGQKHEAGDRTKAITGIDLWPVTEARLIHEAPGSVSHWVV
jgi:hypothetical protein